VARAIAIRLVRLLLVLFVVSLATFFMLELVPGDPAASVVGPDATAEQYEAVREELGLDRPVTERYVDWIGGAVTGDLGQSLTPPSRDVGDLIASRFPVTLEIALLAIVMALAASIPLGMWSAHRAGQVADTATGAVTFGLVSLPSFVTALLLVFFMVFHIGIVRGFVAIAGVMAAAGLAWRAVRLAGRYSRDEGRRRVAVVGLVGAAAVLALGLTLAAVWPEFPRQGFVRWTDSAGKVENLRSAFLPALTLAVTEMAVFTRLLRNDMITTLREDFILAARAKGMPVWRILVRDALRPSSFSLVTVAGVALGRLIGGTVIVETIFRLPGMGTMLVDAIEDNDYTIVQGGVLVVATFYVLVNAAVDLSYTYLDPRIRRGRT
jgi:peptide/nickel transport system permease protein